MKKDIGNTNKEERATALRIIRESMLESPPQLTLYGKYSVSSSLVVTLYSLIISYSLVVQEIVGPSCNEAIGRKSNWTTDQASCVNDCFL